MTAAQRRAVREWYEELKRTSNECFMPLYGCEKRYLVLCGGGGSGKRIFAGRKVLERVSAEPGHRWLVCRKVARTLRDSCFRQLCMQLAEHFPGEAERINAGDMRIFMRSGSEIILAGLDDVEKLKSIYTITGIWVEEASEISRQDFSQLDIRLRGETPYYKQIILTFNPISAAHWLKGYFFDQPRENALTHLSTYRDNRFLDEEAKAVLEAFRDSDPYYYQVYCLGQWGVLGDSIFNAEAVQARLAERIAPRRIGSFRFDYDGLRIGGVAFEDEPDGFIRIYEPPEAGAPYVIGADTAGEGGDWFCAQVLDNRSGRQVAVLRRRAGADVFAHQVYCLGKYYNDALIGIEDNFDRFPIMELERLGYKNQYVRQSMDSFTRRLRDSYGFRTTSRSRETVISGLVQALREDITLVSDGQTLQELLTFVRDENMRASAQAGAHDDCVMALAIAHFIRGQQRTYSLPPAAGSDGWTADMREDFRRAGPEAREYLLQKWGRGADTHSAAP